MSELYVSRSEYYQTIDRLAIIVYESDWQFNQIVCLAKGGLRVGDIFCRLFHQPLAILSATSYGGKDNRIRGELTFSKHLSMTSEEVGSHILLVDDLADSGITLREAIRWLKEHYPTQVQEIRTAVLWYKGVSVIQPDYYVQYLPDSPWIHQPFEYYEQISLADFASSHKLQQ